MKKHILFSLFISGLIIGLFLAGCNNNIQDNNPKPNIVCFGDSLTAGYGAITPGVVNKSNSYPAFLQKKVNIPVINSGVSGDTTTKALARVNKDVLSKKPQIVIILLGANDLLTYMNPYGSGHIDKDQTEANLQQIITKIKKENRKIYLAKFYTDEVAQGIAPSIPPQYGGPEFIQALINEYDEMFTTLAEANDLTLIDDIWTGVWGLHMSSDTIHPNAAGYQIMADNIFNAIRPYLRTYGWTDL